MLHDTQRMEKDDFMGLFCVELSRLNDLTDEYVGVEFMNVYQIDGSCWRWSDIKFIMLIMQQIDLSAQCDD